MPRGVAINVAANTTLPGVRGPVHPDGSFEYVPIPEREPTATPPPTYADLGLADLVPDDVRNAPVHLDPEFAEYAGCEAYTYGDPHGVKAHPILELSAGDYLLFYATLRTRGDPNDPWIAPEWGAYLVGQFRLGAAPVDGAAFDELPARRRERFANNAHRRRETFDAAVLAYGDPDGSRLYDTAVPLSSSTAGADANRAVTELSSDSGAGPWWRRPLRFDAAATDRLLDAVRSGAHGRFQDG